MDEYGSKAKTLILKIWNFRHICMNNEGILNRVLEEEEVFGVGQIRS